MKLDHEAIRKAYSNVTTIYDDKGAFDSSGNEVTIEQSKIDEARTELNKLKYKKDRRDAYPDFAEQLDMQYWDKKNGTTTWVDAISKIKSDNPKP